MAVLGFTRLDAVNSVLTSINELPHPGLDSSGSWPSKTYGAGIAARAEEILERVSRSVQARGYKFNSIKCKKYTAAGSPLKVTFAANVLRADPAGPIQFRNMALRGDVAYDLENDTSTLAAGDYYFDIVTYHDFDEIPPDLKDLIVKEASQEMQRRYRGSAEQDAFITQELNKAEIGAERPKVPPSVGPLNQAPMVTGPALGQAAGGGR